MKSNSAFKRLALVVLWAASLFFVAAWAAPQNAPVQNAPLQAVPVVISGNDFGFQLLDRNGGNAVGVFVVRIDGQWVPAVSAPKVIRP